MARVPAIIITGTLLIIITATLTAITMMATWTIDSGTTTNMGITTSTARTMNTVGKANTGRTAHSGISANSGMTAGSGSITNSESLTVDLNITAIEIPITVDSKVYGCGRGLKAASGSRTPSSDMQCGRIEILRIRKGAGSTPSERL
jgi:hypothetical protein